MLCLRYSKGALKPAHSKLYKLSFLYKIDMLKLDNILSYLHIIF